jgi:nucleotidyltransferase substrate binding protein (TIGR01987 family)
MNDTKDIRWQQRLNQYDKALAMLSEAVTAYHQRPLTRMEKQGAIKAFEFTHELAWNVMKDFFVWQGNTAIMGSRDATREAFAKGLLEDGETWMAMIPSRNQTAHTYNEPTADEILADVADVYYPLFLAFEVRMKQLAHEP